ncbi:thiamine pyrophosphate-binding protein [Roseibium salinum]|nr:thiamine pyrophosphate-binding protein [Roseibium salinum]
MTTGADIIAGKLHAAGCRHAFGIPGGEVLALMQALDQAGMTFVLVKHENAGGFMAEGGWHADGAPGVLLATLGPGAANAVNVVANAWQDRVPLIFLTGCVDQAEAESYTHQVFDHQQLLRPIVKASLSARLGALDVMMDKALAIALDGQPGPVHIDVPIKVAETETGEAWSRNFQSAPRRNGAHGRAGS